MGFDDANNTELCGIFGWDADKELLENAQGEGCKYTTKQLEKFRDADAKAYEDYANTSLKAQNEYFEKQTIKGE
jgi:hypothetical protein